MDPSATPSWLRVVVVALFAAVALGGCGDRASGGVADSARFASSAGGTGTADPTVQTTPSLGVAATEAPGSNEAAEATSPAARGVVVPVAGTGCDLTTVAALAARHPEAGQWIVTRSDSWTATAAAIDVAARSADGRWVCQRGDQMGLVGRSGTRPLLERRSGDGTTPAGVFPLGTTTAWDGQAFQFFGNGPDPGVRGTYRSIRTGDCWGATPGAATYNHLYFSPSCPGADDEYLPLITGAYVHAAVIGANNEPVVSGDEAGEPPYAAAIFLHRHAYDGTRAKPTSGCVSLPIEDLVGTLALIDPALIPRFAIGPTDWLRTSA